MATFCNYTAKTYFLFLTFTTHFTYFNKLRQVLGPESNRKLIDVNCGECELDKR